MPNEKPRVGQLYSPYDQWRMHGGSQQHMLPEKDGRITLIRFHPGRRNPGAPHILDHGNQYRLEERVEMLSRQDEALPVYKFVAHDSWEHIGCFRVTQITDDPQETTKRSEVCGRPIRYVLRLEPAG